MSYDFVLTNGTVVADTSSVQSTVEAVWQDAFGKALSLEPSTPQGRIIEMMTLERKNIMNVLAFMCNQINPNFSTGEYLDAIAGFFDIQREAETYTTVRFVQMTGTPLTYSTGSITITEQPSSGDSITLNDITYAFGDDVAIGGNTTATASNLATAINGDSSTSFVAATASNNVVNLTSTQLSSLGNYYGIEISIATESAEITSESTLGYVLIPAGAEAETEDGDVFVLSSDVLLDASGSASGTFVAKEEGPIQCPVNSLNKILTEVDGWETVNNGSAGTLGALQESDSALRVRIDKSKFKWSTSMVNSIGSAIYEINGVKSLYIYENYEGFDKTNADDPLIPVGETVKAHGVMIIVDGGSNDATFDTKVASAILEKRSGGCNMSAVADTDYVRTIQVRDGIYQTPYNMTFNMAQPVQLYMSLTVQNVSYTGANLADAVRNIIVDWFAGNLEGVSPVSIGKTISIFDITSVLSNQIGVYIKACTIGTSPDNLGINEIPVPITHIATIDKENINITVL
ncbi:baseplate J/gp47 family protein [Candidatus Saccharibacteria bacterium]|nr:baseplate J/gp47 family protein [Candidatus Saccharibacteria bacterium]